MRHKVLVVEGIQSIRYGNVSEIGGSLEAVSADDGPMRAVVHDRYGPPEVLRIEHVPKPVPTPDEILVRIRASGVTRSDAHLRAGEPFVSRSSQGPCDRSGGSSDTSSRARSRRSGRQ